MQVHYPMELLQNVPFPETKGQLLEAQASKTNVSDYVVYLSVILFKEKFTSDDFYSCKFFLIAFLFFHFYLFG